MMEDKVYSNNMVEVTYRKDNITHIHYLIDEITLEISKEILHFTRLNSPWKQSPIYLTGGDFMTQDKESKEFNASKEVTQYCSAMAFLSDSLAKKLLANFFISMYKEKVPMKFFNSDQEAFKWLSQFKTISLDGNVL